MGMLPWMRIKNLFKKKPPEESPDTIPPPLSTFLEGQEDPESSAVLYGPDVLHLCLSLPSRRDRRFVFRQLAPGQLSKAVEFVDGLDGDLVSLERVEKWQHPEATRNSWAVRFAKRVALRRFLHSGKRILAFYEDDCLLLPGFEKDCLKLLREMPADWDIAFLGGQMYEDVSPPSYAVRPSHPTPDNHCLLLSRAGTKKVLRALGQPDHAYSDQVIRNMIERNELKAFWTGRYTAFQRDSQSDNFHDHSEESFGPTLFGVMAGPDDAYLMTAAVKPGDKVLEWGSGGSTALFASRAGAKGQVVSIENNVDYYEKTKSRIEQLGLTGSVDLRLVPPSPSKVPGEWRTLPGQMKAYVETPIKLAPPGGFDVVFIDGRERLQCLGVAEKLIKPGGYLLFHDFWSRARYREHLPQLLEWAEFLCATPLRETRGIVTDLALFRNRH